MQFYGNFNGKEIKSAYEGLVVLRQMGKSGELPKTVDLTSARKEVMSHLDTCQLTSNTFTMEEVEAFNTSNYTIVDVVKNGMKFYTLKKMKNDEGCDKEDYGFNCENCYKDI